MANYVDIGGVPISGFISPGTTSDTFPVIDTTLGIDGLRNYSGGTEVLTGTTITELRRRAGMIVGIDGGDRYFKLKDKDPWDYDLTDWEELDFSGGGSGSAITGGTYTAGTLTLINGSGGTITVTGFSSDNIFTGNTSGDCITDLFVSNIFGCSDLNIQPSGGNVGIGTDTPQFTLDVAGETRLSGSAQNILSVIGSGDTTPILSVEGSVGELLTVNDSLSGLLFAVNDVSGLPTLQVFDDDTILMGDNLSPSLNTTTKINPGTGLSTVYTIPMSAYTGAWFEYTVKNTGGARAGQIMSIFSGNTVNFTETTTTDIGSTSDVSFSMSADSINSILQVSATTTGWEIKTIVRSI